MYPYHNKIKSRITNDELSAYEFVANYNHIKSPVILLYFKTQPFIKPIREHKWEEYLKILENTKCLNE